MKEALTFIRFAKPTSEQSALDGSAPKGSAPHGSAPSTTLYAQLAWQERQKSRLVATTLDGRFVSIVLERGQTIKDGDLLETEDGAFTLRISAQKEQVLKIFSKDSLTMMRLIYHLANRHVKMMINADFIVIEPDPILQRLALSLGGTAELTQSVFEPERGAYFHSHHGATTQAEHHHHQHHSHEHGLDPLDYTHGAIGEELSRLAHGQK